MWFVLDNALVLPEYLVEFEYITNIKTLNDPVRTKSESNNKLVIDTSADGVLHEECNKLF
jgi:hypothetical protein